MSTDVNISAVIPLYNGAAFIGDALDSVIAQTCLPMEVVVVDDGSTDGGAGERIVKAYQHDVSIAVPVRFMRKEHGGQSSARNYGIGQARGDLIALLDQDDRWYPEHLEVLAGPFDSSSHVGLSYSELDMIDDSGNMVAERALEHLHSPQPKMSLADCLGKNMYILPSASLMAKRAWEHVGGFDQRLSGYEDDDLFLRIWCSHGVVYVDRPLSQWRIHAVSSSWTPSMWKSGLVYAEKLIAEYPDNPSLQQFYVRDYIAPRFFRHYLGVYSSLLEQGNQDEGEWRVGQGMGDQGQVDQDNIARVHGAIEHFGRLMKPSLAVKSILSLAGHPWLFSRVYRVARGLRRLASRARDPFPCV
ncbi:MAG: glycosyltransferase [Actinobacteria bacterium]|nr:glycosyltransferase [Actinomycetota bacterium]MCL5446638.1 glycosyltransferase [Actinomycetota bacterium]